MKKIALTTAQLRSLCDEAEALKFANGPNRAFWEDVDPKGPHVVDLWMEHQPFLAQWDGIDHGFNFGHNGGLNIRAMVVAKMRRAKKGRGRTVYLKCDFDCDSFMALARDGNPAQGDGVKARRSA
jgi:hypothetical protein